MYKVVSLYFLTPGYPVRNLFDYLKGGDTLDEFLDDFPSVTKEHAIAVLELNNILT